jgi:multiple sugar transport system substrate-binding protein
MRPVTRRAVLGGLLASPLLAACAGFDTSGAAAPGTVGFLSTQFTPVEERQRYEQVLRSKLAVPVAYNPVEGGVFSTTIKSQAQARNVRTALIGGLYNDLAPLADAFDDVGGLLRDLGGTAGYPDEILKLTTLGGPTPKFVPWMQATYIVAVNKQALQWLPPGADVRELTYDQYLAWARAAPPASGRPVFGIPAGPKGLFYRFIQGYLLPSFTGGQVTTFRGADAEAAWTYMTQLWAATAPASTNYEYMQEPLARGEVLVAWDHVARLIGATKEKPDDWLMVPAPRGPKGRGYMLILAGTALPKGGLERPAAEQVIRGLADPATAVETLRQNAFFPVTSAKLPGDLPAGIAGEADAVRAQATSRDAILALPPVGLGSRDAQVGQVFRDSFRAICLDRRPVRPVLDEQAGRLQALLADAKVACWAPDPAAPVCAVA